MKSIGEQAREFRESMNWNTTEMAKAVGTSRQNIESLEAAPDRKPRYIKDLARVMKRTVDELMSDTVNQIAPPNRDGLVPVISWVQAGSWGSAGDPFQPGDADEWRPCPTQHSKHTFALRVRGDSMTAPSGSARTYPEGCLIFIDPSLCSPKNGDRVVAKLLTDEDGTTFKVYKNEDGRQWLQPLNPSHQPIREPFRVIGTVIGKWEDE